MCGCCRVLRAINGHANERTHREKSAICVVLEADFNLLRFHFSVGVPACARVCSCALSGPALLSVSLGAEGI